MPARARRRLVISDPRRGHLSSASTRSPESSALGTKPRAPERDTSGPKSDESRLETRITAGASGWAVIASATWKPSVSGSCTSSSTTSGRSRQVSVTAVAPSTASPMTVNPSASSRMRAVARNDGWSSTMSTVCAISRGDCLRAGGGRLYGWPHLVGSGGDGGCEAADGRPGVVRAEHRGAGHEQRRARGGAWARRSRRRSRRRPRAPARSPRARAGARSSPSELREELLAAPARIDGHAQHEVDVLDDLADRRDRRAGAERQAGAAAGVAHRLQRVVHVRRGLDVDRDRRPPRRSRTPSIWRSGRSIIRCTSITPPAACTWRARASTTSGPIVIGGTK